MKKTLLTILFGVMAIGMWAVPARRTPIPVVQPNGDTLIVRLIGDEHWHARFTVDGYLICQNSKGYYCYAKWAKTEKDGDADHPVAKATTRVAKNEENRSRYEKRWLRRHKIPKRDL